MNKSFRDTLVLGFALFAIFFGAGNLIFPPAIGLVSGTNWVTALIGFVLTGIALPLLGVIAILNAEGKFEVLTRPISPWFYKFFNTVMMVGIGMCVTIPRMAATTHELGVKTLFPQVPSFVTILLFFAINFYFAMDRSNVVDKIGKILTPVLVVILLFIVGKGIFDPIGVPITTELANPFSNAFINAYQTGDVMTALLCAPIFIAAIAGYGYTDTRKMRKMAINGTLIAGLGLLIVYGGLLYLGAAGSGMFPSNIENTALVTGLIQIMLGNFGSIALAVAIVLACLTSAIGVTAVTADFLSKLTNHKVSYRIWALIICIAGVAVGSLGVDKIINYTMPLFLALYPVSIVIVFLGVFRKYIPNAGAYKGSVLLTLIVSVIETLKTIGLPISFLENLIAKLPLSADGFSWLIPAIVGFVGGALIHNAMSRKQDNENALNPVRE
ncbi:branched-chain amino acid transport system II carrier protein [Brevibacillus reuszeri]|uniref:branched-chain amino acid transport system II carrier protein n=1 Tax=Brevibacillus reuszeri TaxID=54915 RepID=UPI000CCC85D6|nr:branched-chain amino acid transport system II carrier protein [Brevibacillus reuszeri]